MNWHNRRFISAGSSAVVYEIDGKAVKVGDVKGREVERQLHFANKGLALPVELYAVGISIPRYVAQELCYIHGRRNDFHRTGLCLCDTNRADILVMPLAQPFMDNSIETQIAHIIDAIDTECIALWGHGRDKRGVNMAMYEGKIIALDFG